MKKIEVIKSMTGWLLAGAQVASDGLSSARQIVDFTPSPYARYAACGATIVEGEIYRKNIIEGFNRYCLLSEKSLWEYLIIEKFEDDLVFIKQYEKETKNNSYDYKHNRDGTSSYVEPEDEFQFLNLEKNPKTSSFVASYIANQQFIKQAKSRHKKGSEIIKVKARLKLLKKLLIQSVVEPKSCYLLNNAENLNEDFISELKGEVSKKIIKLWPLRFGMLFSLGVGLCLGVITFYTFPAVLIGLGLSTAIASAGIWPLAILAAISYAILIYNTTTDLILNETLSIWWREINKEIEQKYDGRPNILKYICFVIGKSFTLFFNKLIDWFKLKEQETFCSYAMRMVLSFMALACGLIVAGATGFTTFIQLKGYVNVTLCTIATLSFMSSELLFILKNSFHTVGLLAEGSINNLFTPFLNSYENLVTQMAKENYLQYLLHLLRIPLKIVLSIFKLFIFGAHVFFTGVASDRFFGLPCWLMVGISALSELMTDLSQLFSNKQDDHHDHDHGGIFNWIGKIIFIIPATILGILNCLFSQLNRCTNIETSPLGLWEAIKQEWEQFEIMHEHAASSSNESAPTLPKEVVLQRAIHICNKQINRLNNVFFNKSLAKKKVKIFIDYKQQLLQNNQTDPNNNISDSEKSKLNERRYGFFKKGNPESMQKIEKIKALISAVNDNNHFSSNGHATMTI